MESMALGISACKVEVAVAAGGPVRARALSTGQPWRSALIGRSAPNNGMCDACSMTARAAKSSHYITQL